MEENNNQNQNVENQYTNVNNEMPKNNVNNEFNQPVSKSNNKILIAIMAIIIIGLVGYIVYFQFIQKNDDSKPKQNDIQEKENNNSNKNEESNNSNDDVGSSNSNENNSQNQGNSNQQISDNMGNEQTSNSEGLSKKLISLKGSCNDVSESYNGIKVELKKSPNSERCLYDLKINDKRIFNDDQLELKSIEIYDNYVIVFTISDGGSAIYLVDTTNKNYKVYDGVEYHDTDTLLGCSVAYNPDSYISDEDGILITGSDFSGPCGTANPGHKYAKIRVPYKNGKFGSPEIIEKYD